MSVLYVPEPEHHCYPGYELRELDQLQAELQQGGYRADPGRRHRNVEGDLGATHYLHDLGLPVGSIWQCDDCGKIWVARQAPRPSGGYSPIADAIEWRPETTFERWRRELRR